MASNLHCTHLVGLSPNSAGLHKKPQLIKISQRYIACSSSPSTTHNTNTILDWLVFSKGAQSADLNRVFLSDDLGYGLVAGQDIEPGATLLSIPMSVAITSEGADESEWSLHMAKKILAAVKAGPNPWLDALPENVRLPWLPPWTEGDIQQLQDPDTIAEALFLRQMYEEACKESSEWSPEQLAWALSLVHSRSFIDRNTHILVPGIDMCNHTLNPSAQVRTAYSPEACQGSQATEEIAPPQPVSADNESRFELIAGDDGIKAGEEVTISYGSWPNDVFLLFFGWVQESNPNDSAVLFADVFDLADFRQRLVDQQPTPHASTSNSLSSNAHPSDDELLALLPVSIVENYEAYNRMVVTANGLDGRLVEAANAVLQSKQLRNQFGLPVTLPEFLQQRCKELLSSYPTTLEQDEELLIELQQQEKNGNGKEKLEMAVRYRLGKKKMLMGVVEQFESEMR